MASRHKKSAAKKPARKNTSADQRELQRIEKLLGEEFESLRSARAALKSESGPVPRKKSYTTGELSRRKHSNIKTWLADVEEHKAEIDELKRPEDFWAARIYGYKTYQLFENTGRLVQQLSKYQDLQKHDPADALKKIEIIKVTGVDAGKYYDSKRKEVKATWKKRQAQHALDRKTKRRQEKKLQTSERIRKEQAKKIKQLMREQQKLQKKLHRKH